MKEQAALSLIKNQPRGWYSIFSIWDKAFTVVLIPTAAATAQTLQHIWDNADGLAMAPIPRADPEQHRGAQIPLGVWRPLLKDKWEILKKMAVGTEVP